MIVVTDFCEPCPSHGVCYEGKLECASGYRKQGRSCIEDGDINETAMKLVCNNTYLFWYSCYTSSSFISLNYFLICNYCMMLLQLKLVETRVCEAYSKYLCEGTGTIWVRNVSNPLNSAH